MIQYEVSALQTTRNVGTPQLLELRDYLGIGAGAHGKLTLEGQILRVKKLPARALHAALPLRRTTGVPGGGSRSHSLEFMLNQLRLRQGCSEAEFAARTGLNISALEPALSKPAQGLIVADRIQTTDLGWRFLNDDRTVSLNRSINPVPNAMA